MSKGLEALERISNHIEVSFDYSSDDDLNIIEKELKEHEQHEEILNYYGLTLANFREACLLLALLKGEGRNIRDIDKQLKTFETIKHFIKSLALTFVFSNDKTIVIVGGDDFEYWYKCETQEEYDLLKEVML